RLRTLAMRCRRLARGTPALAFMFKTGHPILECPRRAGGVMYRLELKHPRAIRWMHWINFPVLAILIWNGLLIYWASDTYSVRIGGFTLFHFFPDWFYRWLGLESNLAVGMAYHFAFAWLLAINGLAYVVYTLFSGEWRHLLPNRQTPREA